MSDEKWLLRRKEKKKEFWEPKKIKKREKAFWGIKERRKERSLRSERQIYFKEGNEKKKGNCQRREKDRTYGMNKKRQKGMNK